MVPHRRRPVPVDGTVLDRLEAVWSAARAAGALGSSSLETLRAHACGYLLEQWPRLGAGRFIDCGTGSGVLGVLLSLELPDSRWTLVDASERRCDLARQAVAAAGLGDRVSVEHAVLEDLARTPIYREGCDGVVARSFGPATELAECALPLLRPEAALVVSVSADTSEMWRSMPLRDRTGCEVAGEWSTPYGRFLSVRRVGPVPERLPRRRASRRRSPLSMTVSRET